MTKHMLRLKLHAGNVPSYFGGLGHVNGGLNAAPLHLSVAVQRLKNTLHGKNSQCTFRCTYVMLMDSVWRN